MKQSLLVILFTSVHLVFASMVIADHSEVFVQASQAYESGDFKKAHQLWMLEAEKGGIDAQMKIAAMYREGEGVPQNNEIAMRWYRMAAEKGDVSAQFILGDLYLKGKGVEQSHEYAYAWWLVATANGNKYAKRKRLAIQEQMTPGQIEKAQHLTLEILLRLGD